LQSDFKPEIILSAATSVKIGKKMNQRTADGIEAPAKVLVLCQGLLLLSLSVPQDIPKKEQRRIQGNESKDFPVTSLRLSLVTSKQLNLFVELGW
jgi:hypothetical protein